MHVQHHQQPGRAEREQQAEHDGDDAQHLQCRGHLAEYRNRQQ